MKVKVLYNFNDLEAKTNRVVGDVFECTEERAKFLIEKKAVEEVVEVKEENVKPLDEEVVEKLGEDLEEATEVKPKKKKKKD